MHDQVDLRELDGRITGRATKADAHRTGALHAVAVAQIINSRKEYLLVRQSEGRQDPGQFVLPVGGHINAGETELEALHREAHEELHLELSSPLQRAIFPFRRRILGRDENHLFYVYEAESDATPILNHESAAFHWFSEVELIEALQRNRAEFARPMLTAYRHLYPDFLR